VVSENLKKNGIYAIFRKSIVVLDFLAKGRVEKKNRRILLRETVAPHASK